MRPELLSILRSPLDGTELGLEGALLKGGRVRSGALVDRSGNHFPIVEFIPRFVDLSNYCDNFSVEWENHPDILRPKEGENGDYRDRFARETRWPANLTGQVILEAGCGPGAFTGIALETGATVVSFDLSRSIEQSMNVHGHRANLLVMQASITEMPFAPGTFDRVFCFGVLQHTPDPQRSFSCLTKVLKPGGHLAADVYIVPPERHAYTGLLRSKYLLRRWVPRGNPDLLYRLVRGYVAVIWPLSRLLSQWPKGIQLSRRFLIDDYPNRLPQLDSRRYREFAVLDIYDMLSPAYDFPQTLETFREWFATAGLVDLDVHPGYNGLEGRGRRPLAAGAEAVTISA